MEMIESSVKEGASSEWKLSFIFFQTEKYIYFWIIQIESFHC